MEYFTPTGFGQPIILNKPATRKASIHFPLLSALKKAGHFLTSVLAASFWFKGASTRATAHIIRQTFGVNMTSSDISTITSSLEPVITQWLSRDIPDNIRYLFLDALYLPVRRRAIGPDNQGFTSKQALLSAIGIDSDGKTHTLGFLLGDRENNDSWNALLQDLLHRGLKRNNLRLVISDEHKAIIHAVNEKLAIPHQYCLFHKIKNVRFRVSRPDWKAFLTDLKEVYWAINLQETQRAAGRLEAKWIQRYPKAVEIALANFDNYTMFFREPREYWRVLRTTNKIERFNKELRRRLRPAGAMHSELELWKIVWNVSSFQESQWAKHRAFKVIKTVKEQEVA